MELHVHPVVAPHFDPQGIARVVGELHELAGCSSPGSTGPEPVTTSGGDVAVMALDNEMPRVLMPDKCRVLVADPEPTEPSAEVYWRRLRSRRSRSLIFFLRSSRTSIAPISSSELHDSSFALSSKYSRSLTVRPKKRWDWR